MGSPFELFVPNPQMMMLMFSRATQRLNCFRHASSHQLNPKVTHEVTISNLSPHNMYESIILSTLSDRKGSRIEKFSYVPALHDAELLNLQTLQKLWYPENLKSFFKSRDKSFDGKYNEDTTFEVDLYFKSWEDIANCREFFQGCVLDLHRKTNVLETSLANKWIFVEITSSPHLLLQKLFQLERAVRLLPKIDNQYRPEALCVLLNGPEDVAKQAINLVTIPNDALINSFPLYIGWVPTRNIYKSVIDLERKFDSKIGALDSKIGALDSKIDSLERSVKHEINLLDSKFVNLERKFDTLTSVLEKIIATKRE